MKWIIDRHQDLTVPAAIADDFRKVYWRVGEKALAAKGTLDRFLVGHHGTEFAYRKVCEYFS